MAHYHEIAHDLKGQGRELRDLLPDTYAALGRLHTTVLTDGAVPERLKQGAALAVAVVKRCDGCIAYHARACVTTGATREEVAEMIGVAILMDGGPASVWGPRALAAYDEFTAER